MLVKILDDEHRKIVESNIISHKTIKQRPTYLKLR